MSTNLGWKKGILASTYRIFSGNVQVGELKNHSFKQQASASLYNQAYRFEAQNFFNQSTFIIDTETNVKIGTIVYNAWHTKATITIFKKQYDWKFNNIWNTQWSLFDNKKLLVDNVGSSGSGKIESTDAEPLLILSSLYVTNYYWQSTVAVFISLFPIYILLFS